MHLQHTCQTKLANLEKMGELLPAVQSWLPSTCVQSWAVAAICAFGLFVAILLMLQKKPIYLLDLACYRPPDELKVTYQAFLQGSVDSGVRGIFLPTCMCCFMHMYEEPSSDSYCHVCSLCSFLTMRLWTFNEGSSTNLP